MATDATVPREFSATTLSQILVDDTSVDIYWTTPRDWPLTGHVVIDGREIARYERNGRTLKLIERGMFSTRQVYHRPAVTIQYVYTFEGF